MTRFKINFGMRTRIDDDELAEGTSSVATQQDTIITGPDKSDTSQHNDAPPSSPSSSCSPTHLLTSRRRTLSASIQITLFSSLVSRPRMRRDTPVMESCEMRTVIEPDKSSSSSSSSTIVSRSPRSLPPPPKTNLNNSYSNYKSCTELTTTSMSAIIMILWIMMGSMVRRILSNIWRSFRHHQHHHQRHLHSNYKHRSPRVNSCLRTFIIHPLIFCFLNGSLLVHGQPPPLPPAGFLDFDNLPVTRFSCEGKVIGGYYADVETGCQMFHVCTLGQKDEIQDIKFLCLNGTVFDQETRVCERVDEVDCSKAEQFFDLNLDLYVPHATTQKPEEPDLEEEDDNIRPIQTSASSGSKQKSRSNNNNPPPPPPPSTRPTTTTTTPTPSPRTRPPTTSQASRSRSPPLISRASAQRQSSSSQQDEDEEEDEVDDRRNSGNNAYTSFNYYLKTPHSHVQSGYNSQSRQSYLINQPGRGGGGDSRGQSQQQAGPSGSGSSNNPVAATTSTGRKVPSGPGQKTIIYSSTSTSSSSTQRPKTIVVVKSTLPPSKSILKPKTLATPRSTTTTTPVPPPKYELDDQYDEYYDDEDYPLEQQQQQQQQQQQTQPKSSSSYQQQSSYPVNNKPALTGSYDFRDGRSTKGVANAGQTSYSSSTTGRSPSTTTSDRTRIIKPSVLISSSVARATPKPVLVSPANIKVISSEFVGNNSTEDPYYYEDDYPDDATLQQQQEDRHVGYSSTSPSSSHGRSPSSSSSSTSSRGHVVVSSSSKGKSGSLEQSKIKPGSVNLNKQKESQTSSADTSDYYDDDTENVNPHDHHFTHVDVPRIPFAKPNVPRVLVTNGKPFLPRLRRQSHHHFFSPPFNPPPQQPRQYFIRDQLHLPPPGVPSRPLQRSTASLLDNNFQRRAQHHHQPHPPQHHHPIQHRPSPIELRREARAKAIEWGRDPRPFR